MSRVVRGGAALLAVAPIIWYAIVGAHLTTEYELPTLHFFVVVGSSLAAAAISVLITRAALRRNDLRAGLTGLGFTVMAGLLAIHGLATPGFFLEEYGRNATVGLAGALAVPAGGVVLALAIIAPPNLRGGRKLVLRSQVAVLAVLVAFGAVGLLHPELVPLVPVSAQPWALLVLCPTAALYWLVANRAFHIYRLTRRRADLWVSVGMVWLGSSIILYLLSAVWTAGFWGAHALEAIGFVAVAGSVAVDLARQRPSNMLFERLGGSELVTSEETLLGGYVRSLTASLEEHDPSTGRHSRRVAQLAVRVGERMGLGPDRVRRLAVAGLVHDIGKLHIPSEILNKPGKLTDEEYAEIKTHPGRGADLLRRLGGFAEEVGIVAAHHERFTGGGYPNDLSGEQIPLEARILTVCDVYDALTEDRPYREAWTQERALQLIRDETGTTFDPACSAALLEELAPPDVRVLRRALGAAVPPRATAEPG